MANKPTVKLVGEDGNVFSIISRVSKALERVGMRDEACVFRNKAIDSPSYNAVLRLVAEYVEIE